ncbi:RsfA family transcriptional regulator [Salibacterium aidingense]|uniref:RsfA family transcriptional regulator n=1 Tax=Salibacterium aidingense TaxID=384933 RepID=UPI0004270266|nr:RsfA family transcriptional regulator [Salibacterium aidingense]
MNIRQDAWSDKDDKYLAETILKHIREGSTQLKAFDEVGDALDRTSAACGFRWNAIVRLDYNEEVKQAKRERKQKMRASAHQAATKINPSAPRSLSNINSIISALKDMEKKLDSFQHASDAEKAEAEAAELQTRNAQLREEIDRINQEYETVKQDYDLIVHMMNRARELAMTEESSPVPNFFRMDKNGNLEKIANG